MTDSYEPKEFWEHRLSGRFSLKGVGNRGFSESYNGWLYRRKQCCIESCFAEISLKGKTVLDIGCGTGFFVQWYLAHEAIVSGVDITNISIETLKQQYQCAFYTQDITDSDYSLHNEEFDIINMWDVAYHIVDYNRFDQAFENIAQSAKEDGLLLCTDFFGASSDTRVASHVQGRCLETYQECLPQKGFELAGLYPLYNFLNKPHVRGRIDNYLGWLYFLLDNRCQNIPTDNLSLSVWRYGSKHGSPSK